LVESMGGDPDGDAARFEAGLSRALEDGEIADAAVAGSKAQGEALWALRDDVGQTVRNGPVIAFDVSLPIGAMEGYVTDVCAALLERWPALGAPAVFGHLGDGNLHIVPRVTDYAPDTRRALEEIV